MITSIASFINLMVKLDILKVINQVFICNELFSKMYEITMNAKMYVAF